MAVDVKLMTVEELEAMPDDGRRVELVRGELIEMPPPAEQRGAIVATLAGLLVGPIKGQRLGTVLAESGIVISRHPATVLAPDVMVKLGGPPAARDQVTSYSDRLPAIAFEIVSPSDSADAVHDKLRTYLEAGVPMVIAVWPRREEVTVAMSDGRWSVLTAADELDLSELVPGLRIRVADIFE